MKIIIAPDSFKGSLTAQEAAEHIENGIKSVIPECETILIPLADGGEGTAATLTHALRGEFITAKVKNPLFKDIDAQYGICGNIAVIEMSAASGITLLAPQELNPTDATTYGTGQLIADALAHGCNKIIIGIGGSATNDGGMGMAAALNVKFKDKNGEILSPCAKSLSLIESIDTTQINPLVRSAQFFVACDVTNTICGENGASYVFGPQKGATPSDVVMLDNALLHYCAKIREYLGIKIENLEGGGAAGGLGAGLFAFCNARLEKGFEIISETLNLYERFKGANLIITGEGRTDFQTAFGKLPCSVGEIAKSLQIPCIAISGAVDGDISNLYYHGITAIFSGVSSVISLEEAMKNAGIFLERAAENALRLFLSK